MVKFLPKLLEDRDKNVREETKQLVVEMYRWVGAAIKPKLVDFKPVQVKGLSFFCLLTYFSQKNLIVVKNSHVFLFLVFK